MLNTRMNGWIPQLGSLLFLPEFKQFLHCDFGPVNIPRITVVFGQQYISSFTGFCVTNNIIDWMTFIIPANSFLHYVWAAAIA